MTIQAEETVNVLPELNRLRELWKKQNYSFSDEQQLEYNMLIEARRYRVKYFYENNLVAKPRPKVEVE